MPSKKHPWWKERKYVHFDYPMGRKVALKRVTDPKFIASHGFWPLIGFSKRERLWRKSGWKRKRRPIAYASHVDSNIYAYYAYILSEKYENIIKERGLGDCVLAYRPGTGKANYHHAADAFGEMVSRGEVDVLGIDIEKFFDHIPHHELKSKWKELLNCSEMPKDHYKVYKNCTRFSVVSMRQIRKAIGYGKRRLRKMHRIPLSPPEFRSKIVSAGLVNVNPNSFGIPQGLPISGVLANLVLLDVDFEVHSECEKVGGVYRRYSDDILLICPCGTSSAIEACLRKMLNKMGLSYQEEKVLRRRFIHCEDTWKCVEIDENGKVGGARPIQYLGFEFDGKQVTLRPQTQVRLNKRMIRSVRMARNAARNRTPAGVVPKIRRRKLYEKYSHLRSHPETPEKKRARGTFYGYTRRAEAAFAKNEVVRQFEIILRKQLRNQCAKLIRLIDEADQQLLIEWKRNKNKSSLTQPPSQPSPPHHPNLTPPEASADPPRPS